MTGGIATATLLPDRPKRRYEEATAQRSFDQYLLWSLPADAVHFAIPNGLMRSKKARQIAQGQGVRAGVPDLCIIHRGRPIFVEVKAAKGVVSEAQRNMMRKLTYCGAEVLVCRTVPGLECALRELGVPLKASVAA